jgi:ribosomal protein S13
MIRRFDMCDEEKNGVESHVHVVDDSLGKKIACAMSEVGEHVEEGICKAMEFKRKAVLIKLSDELVQAVDRLVESGLFESRTDAAVFLMTSGLNSESELFGQIEDRIEKIQRIREEMKEIVGEEILRRAGVDPEKSAETVDKKIDEMHRLRDEIKRMVGGKFFKKSKEGKESEES